MYPFSSTVRYVAFAAATMMAGGAHALSAMDEQEMAAISGAGIAIGFDDLRVRASGTTFLEYTGTTGVGNFQRADARYYGMSLSGTTPVTSWGGVCSSGIANMGCPIGNRIPSFAAFDNPYLLRAFDYSGIRYNGSTENRTVLELLGPTSQSPWRLASWAELDVGSGNAVHQGQMILNNSTFTSSDGSPDLGDNSKIRILRHNDPLDPTVGFIWENHYQGDFRYSVAQTSMSLDQQAVIPFFDDIEGFYALNIQAFVPMGQMHYQSLLLDDAKGPNGELGGNFRISLSQIPDQPAVYSDFYSLAQADSTNAGYDRTGRPNRYYETHGFFRVGSAGTTNNNGTLGATGTRVTDVSDGIFFVGSPSAGTFSAYAERPDISPGNTPGAPDNYQYTGLRRANIGDIKIEGMMIHNMSIVTCSAGAAADSPC